MDVLETVNWQIDILKYQIESCESSSASLLHEQLHTAIRLKVGLMECGFGGKQHESPIPISQKEQAIGYVSHVWIDGTGRCRATLNMNNGQTHEAFI